VLYTQLGILFLSLNSAIVAESTDIIKDFREFLFVS